MPYRSHPLYLASTVEFPISPDPLRNKSVGLESVVKQLRRTRDIDENCPKNLDVGDAIEPNLRSIQGKMHTVNEVYVKPLMYGRRRGAEEEG